MSEKIGFQFICSGKYIYSGPPLMRPPLGNWKTGRITGVAAGEGDAFVYTFQS